MRTAELVRNPSSDDGTFGRLTLDDGSTWITLELPWRDNHAELSCIPTGIYRCAVIDSPKHGNPTYEVMSVPGRDMIEIHSANWAGDVTKDLHCQLLGCIGLGKAIGVLDHQQAITSSKQAVAEFMANLNSEPFELTIS